MLEVGKAGSAGVEKGVLPVLRGGAVVATVRASNWKEAATAVVGDREWLFANRKRELTARWAVDPEESVRLRARQTSFWKGTWEVDLGGAPLRRETVSFWKGTHRYSTEGRVVAEVGSTGGWSPRPTLSAEDSLPLEARVFLLWLEVVINRRNAATISAGAGAAVIVGGSS
ncbi:hypothetical protein [Geodermatophilus ruber]|uniref:Uncharacterized protein n=1 Tax=Geodermatophilus ruber TaxID=504800 RepID=A0A1I4E7E7_9ACTN|nr:hypothetical protein [Geodermatophilus ruber]SFL01754.1 hypothetical protein SAMN04488085_105286 [Geodermatophilus ruber]